jgi:hypothetical protein
MAHYYNMNLTSEVQEIFSLIWTQYGLLLSVFQEPRIPCLILYVSDLEREGLVVPVNI